MSDIYFPDMRRVKTEHGDYVEPALNQDWPMLTRLEWQLAVLRVDTGIRMWVKPGELPNQFSYWAVGFGYSSMGFHYAWNFINGVSMGVKLAQERRATADKIRAGAINADKITAGVIRAYEPARWTQPNFAPGISSVIRDRIEADGWQVAFQDRINDMKAKLQSVIDSRGYRAQDTTVLFDEWVTNYE